MVLHIVINQYINVNYFLIICDNTMDFLKLILKTKPNLVDDDIWCNI